MSDDIKHGPKAKATADWNEAFFSARTRFIALSELRTQRYPNRQTLDGGSWGSQFRNWKNSPDASTVKWDKMEQRIQEECDKYARYAAGSEKFKMAAAILAGVGVTTFLIMSASHAALSSNAMINLEFLGGGALFFSLVAVGLALFYKYNFHDSFENNNPLAEFAPASKAENMDCGSDWREDHRATAAYVSLAKLSAITLQHEKTGALSTKNTGKVWESAFYNLRTNPPEDMNKWDEANEILSENYVAFENHAESNQRFIQSSCALLGAAVAATLVGATCHASLSHSAMGNLIVYGGIFPLLLGVGLLAGLSTYSNPPQIYPTAVADDLQRLSPKPM